VRAFWQGRRLSAAPGVCLAAQPGLAVARANQETGR